MNALQIIKDTQRATLAARARLADARISVHTEAGRAQVVLTWFEPGSTSASVRPVSEWMPAADVARYLDGMVGGAQ